MDRPPLDKRSWPIAPMLIAMAASLPCAASLVFSSIQRLPQTPRPSGERASLVFDQYLVNLDNGVHHSTEPHAIFRFLNTGKSPLRITNLAPSCGCLHSHLEKRLYEPGEAGTMTLSVLTTREQPGSHEYEMRVEYADPMPHVATVAFKMTIRREVNVRPSQLVFYQNGKRESEQSVVVTDMREKPLLVTGANCKSANVKLKVGAPVDIPDGGRRTSVSITVAPRAAEGGEDLVVFLTTDDQQFPTIPIALRIRDVNARVTQAKAAANATEPKGRAVRPAVHQRPAP